MRILFWLTIFLTITLVASLHADSVSLEGNWKGSGTVQPKEGPAEKVLCRVNYKRETDKVFRIAAKCATTSNQINQTGQLLKVNPGVYVGEFYIASYDIAGRVRVVVKGSTQTMIFKGSTGHGRVTLKKV